MPGRSGFGSAAVAALFLAQLCACGGSSSQPAKSPAPAAVTGEAQSPLTESLTQAIEAAESILKITPNDPDALLAAALASEHLGQFDKAIAYYERLQKVTRETEHLKKLADLQRASKPVAAARAASEFFAQGGEDDDLRMWLIRRLAGESDLPGAYRLTEGLTPPEKADREFLRDLCLRHAQRLAPGSVDALAAIRRSGAFAPLPDGLVETAALTLLAAGDAPAARDLIRPYAGPAHLVRAKIADRLHDPSEALKQRLKYYETGGSDPHELLVLLDSLGRAPPARRIAEQLWRTASLEHRARLSVAEALARFYREAIPPDTAAEIKFLEEARQMGEPAFLERLADLQQSVGNARDALATMRSRYPQGIPESRSDFYVSQALSAGESDEAIRVASRLPASALSVVTRRRLAEFLRTLAENHLAAGQSAQAREKAALADRFHADVSTSKLLAKIALVESDTIAALSQLAATLRSSPADLFANYMTGKILASQSRWVDAKAYLQKAYAGRFPEDDLPLLLGQIHFREQQPMAYPLLKEYADAHPAAVSIDLMDMLGRAAARSGQASDAVVWFERRLKERENETISAELLGAAQASGQRAKALGLARSLVIKYPSSRPILESASAILDFSMDSLALVKTLESLSALEPDAAKKYAIQRRLLDAKVKMGRMGEADQLLSALLLRDPNDPHLLAVAWQLRKGTAAAEPILQRLAGIRAPGDPIQVIRARQLLEDRNPSAALTVLREYLGIRRDDADALGALAEVLIRLGDRANAADAYRKLMKIRPDDGARRWLIGHIYDAALAALAEGKPMPNAPALYVEAKDLLGSDQKYKDLYEVFGKLFGAMPATRALAIDAIQRELTLAQEPSRKAQLSEQLGRWFVEDGQLVLAKEMFAASRAGGNRSAAFLRAYGNLMARIGENEAASAIYAQVLQEAPYDREANLYVARRAVASRKLDEAIHSLEALKAASPSDSGAMDALARAYVAAGRHADAAEIWSRIAPFSEDPRVRGSYADALYDAGRHKSALQEYRRLYSAGAAAPAHLRRLAELEQSLGNWSAAEAIILKLLRMGGTEKDRAAITDVLRRIGLVALQRRNAFEASRSAERLLALNANDPSAFVIMGRAKLLEGRTTAASESFSRARSLAPKDPRPMLGLAEVEFKQSRWAAAADYARKAIAIDPSVPEAYTLLGLSYQKQGNVKKAFEAFKESLTHSKNRALAHVRMGDLFLQNGKFNVALEQYRQALAIDPKNALAHYRNAVTLHRLGFSENAMSELLTAIDLDPQGVGADATVLLSQLFESHGDNEKARDLLEAAARQPSAPPGALYHLGERARRGGELTKSMQLFRQALAASDDPAFKYDVLNAMGLALSDLDEAEAAEKTFKEASAIRPDRPNAFLNLSLLHRTRKNFLAAVDAARKAIGAAPKNPEGYKLLGLIYYEAGWEKESLSAFRESLKLRPDQPEIVTIVRSIEGEEDEQSEE